MSQALTVILTSLHVTIRVSSCSDTCHLAATWHLSFWNPIPSIATWESSSVRHSSIMATYRGPEDSLRWASQGCWCPSAVCSSAPCWVSVCEASWEAQAPGGGVFTLEEVELCHPPRLLDLLFLVGLVSLLPLHPVCTVLYTKPCFN